jgi:hypothetical protein
MRLFPGLLFTWALLFITISSKAQAIINSDSLLNKTVLEYEKAEWNIHLSAPFDNPYDQKEITLDMVLTAPSGNPVVLPCYFESGNSTASLWKARFAPQEKGRYSYYFQLTLKDKSITSAQSTFNALPGKKPGFLHKNNYYTFKFDNGELFRGIGENVGWESRSFEDPKWTYDRLLPTLSKNGANFFRTWMCPWNLPLEWKISGNPKRYANTTEYFNPGGIKRMEELLYLVDSLHLYMMLTLDMNSPNWRTSPYNAANGGPVKTWAEFFTSQAAMDKYKNKLRYVVARWGYSTNIAAFEFFNEIDNGVFTKQDSIIIPHANITNWHQEMARYLKDIDPYRHLVTTSISHRDITGLNSIAYIDFNQKHIYKHTEKIPAIYPDYIQTYGKPYVVGEFGYRWEDANPQYAKEADYDYKRGLWFGLFSPTPILPMSWWWEFFDDQNMTPYLQSVREISDRMLKAGNGNFEQINVSAGLLHAQAVKCGNTWFIYLLNESDNAISTPVSLSVSNNKILSVQSFTPSNRDYKKVSGAIIKNKVLTLDHLSLPAKQELVLVLY